MGIYGGAYVHMYAKYEVSMSNPVPGGGVYRWHQQRWCQCQWGQTKALWLINQMSQKVWYLRLLKIFRQNLYYLQWIFTKIITNLWELRPLIATCNTFKLWQYCSNFKISVFCKNVTFTLKSATTVSYWYTQNASVVYAIFVCFLLLYVLIRECGNYWFERLRRRF